MTASPDVIFLTFFFSPQVSAEKLLIVISFGAEKQISGSPCSFQRQRLRARVFRETKSGFALQ